SAVPYAVAAPGPLPRGRAIGASPAPWMDFCRRNGGRARCGAPETRVALTEARWAQLVDYQRRVNHGVVQRPDPVGVGDDWRLLEPGEGGDCEDIALTKRAALIEEGWPAGALRPAICYAHNQTIGGRELHLVLTAETDAGTFVLGNLTDEVRPWQDSDCAAWVMRAGSGGWHWIAGGIGVPLRPAGG
ncbi:MAG: transglutaminase-like cysteine peptidase, partial [Azospirillaceae bacterium]